MAQYAIFLGGLWLAVSFWMDSGWPEDALWAGLLPAVWLLTLAFLVTGGSRGGE